MHVVIDSSRNQTVSIDTSQSTDHSDEVSDDVAHRRQFNADGVSSLDDERDAMVNSVSIF